MLAVRLVRLIESHSDQLARGLMHKFETSEKCSDLRKVPREELHARSHEIYRNLSDWLMHKTEGEVERRYLEIGERRASQGVSLSHYIWAIAATKEHLREFLQREGFGDRPIELYGQLEMLHLLDQFFDRAVYYAAVGYERARATSAAETSALPAPPARKHRRTALFGRSR